MKKLQNKILLIFFIIGTIIIIGMGAFFAGIVGETQDFIGTSEYVTSQDLINITDTQMNQAKILILGTILVFSCIVIVVGIFISEAIVKPLNKMIINAQKLANGESVELIELNPKKKRKKKTELDSIINIISVMNVEMNQKLNEVNRQKREIEAILLHMNDGIVAFDEKGNIMHINPAAKALLKIDKESNFEEIFSRFDANIKMDAILYLDNTAEEKIVIGDKTINVFLASYKDENDLSSGIIAVIQNITEHVKLDDMRKEFVADVSHELKTPITSMRVLADSLISGDNVPVDIYREFMQDISDEIDRETKIINDLLTLVRMDKNATELNISQVNINNLVEQILKRVRPIAKTRSIEIIFESFRPVTADVDETKLSLAVTNLVENGVKYNNDGGWVRVSVNADHKYFYIKVSDSGVGIPKDAQTRIYERFYRVDKARSRETGGTGLGLAITKNVVQLHHGGIKLNSTPGEGTTFLVRIPLKYIE